MTTSHLNIVIALVFIVLAAGFAIFTIADHQANRFVAQMFPERLSVEALDDKHEMMARAERWMRLGLTDLEVLMAHATDYDQAMALWERLLTVDRDLQKLIHISVAKMDKLDRQAKRGGQVA